MGDRGDLFCRESIQDDDDSNYDFGDEDVFYDHDQQSDATGICDEELEGQCEPGVSGYVDVATSQELSGGSDAGSVYNLVSSGETVRRGTQRDSQKRREHGSRRWYLERFESQSRRNTITHQVYAKREVSDCIAKIREIIQRNFRGSVYMVCNHGDHFHVVHDCSRAGERCRCHRIIEMRRIFGRPVSERFVRDHNFTVDHWINLTDYFEKDERSLEYLEICGRERYPRTENREISIQGSEESGQEQVVDDSVGGEGTFRHLVSIGSCDAASGAGPSPGNAKTNETTGRNKGRKTSRLEKFLRKFLASPITHLLTTSFWIKSDYYLVNTQSNRFQCILRKINFDFNRMSVHELFLHSRTIELDHRLYMSPTEMVFDYYYDIKNSVYILDELLLFQYKSAENVKLFLKDLLDLLDKTIPKKNCMHVEGPPCSGKNLFFDCVIAFCINHGQMRNFNKYNSFPLMNCVDRRILYWNEPVLESSAVETLKMIFGGDTCTTPIKHQNDRAILRTPVICMSNNSPFPKDEAFRCRMFHYQWSACEDLKLVKRKPHPSAFPYLLIKYGCWEDVTLSEQELQYVC